MAKIFSSFNFPSYLAWGLGVKGVIIDGILLLAVVFPLRRDLYVHKRRSLLQSRKEPVVV